MSASYNHFTCRTYKKDGEACTGHYIRECVLDEVVLEDLRRVTAMAREHSEEFAAYIGSRQSAEIQRGDPQAGERTGRHAEAENGIGHHLQEAV